MPQLAHFALNADDLDAARLFYQSVFGWRFIPWGPPEFYKIDFGDEPPRPTIMGALQRRRDLVDGQPTIGVEATFAVSDVDDTARRVVDAGGKILMDRFTITGVGHLIFFPDPAGNAIGAMQYDEAS